MQWIPFRAFWKGLKGNSLVFSLVFAMALLGFSLAGLLRSPMRAIGIWGPLIFLLPFIAIGFAAKLERRLNLETWFRRVCCLILILGSILLTLLLFRYEAWITSRYEQSLVTGPKFKEPASSPALPRGPRGRP